MQDKFFEGFDQTNWTLVFADGTSVCAENDGTHQTITVTSPEGDEFAYRTFELWFFPFGLSDTLNVLSAPGWDELALNCAMENEDKAIDKL